jgi:deoxyribodipyrimidine photo-lyase
MMTDNKPTILWFRRDLRLADHPMLATAVQEGAPIIALYVHESDGATRPLGGASKWWLERSLLAFEAQLSALGVRLIIHQGIAGDVLSGLAHEVGAGAVYWSRLYDPDTIARDKLIKQQLEEQGLRVQSFNANLLFEPWTVKTKTAGTPFKVFTPFWKSCLEGCAYNAPDVLPAPATLPVYNEQAALQSVPVAALKLYTAKPDWAKGWASLWQPGEQGAQQQLERFLHGGLSGYAEGRDYPAKPSTSRLSPHLHWGEISPRQVWRAAEAWAMAHSAVSEKDRTRFVAELGWREFSHHLLYHFPTLVDQPLDEKFAAFEWLQDDEALQRWQRGQTGYPIVDAGLRELWQTGWMHNRVRMIVGSFLIKDLLIDWREGEAWFWDTLVDADLPNNVASWQWVAGCGADAAPFFRIFNPVLQGEKFDPTGAYIRKYVPELAHLPDNLIHKPWETVVKGYPAPMVDHKMARDRALAALKAVRPEKVGDVE